MGASDSRSRPENVHYENPFAGTSQSSQNPFKPHQERRQQQTSFVHGGTFVSQPSTGFPQSRPIFQQSQQTTPGGTTYRTGQQNPRQTSRPNVQQPAPQAPKPKKQTVSEVVLSLKEVLNGYDGRKFTLEGVDALYRLRKGENIPYAALGFTSLSAFIESKCPFLMIFTGVDGNTQILLRPPSYQEATNHSVPSTPVFSNPQEKNRVSDLVHDEISQTDFNRLKQISDTKAKNGLTIQQFDDHYLAEFRTRIDFKGFSKAAFFRGLGDIVEMREERDGLKLYSKTRPQNAPKTPAKTPTQQNTAKENKQGADKKTPSANNKKPQGGNNTKSTPKHQGQNKECRQQQRNQKPNQRSASNSREPGTKKIELAPYYEKELRKIIQECKSPEGVTPKEFKKYFNDHSTLAPFKEFGCSNEEFFKALPHIFQVQQVDNAIRLKPAPLTSGFARNNFAQWQSTSALDGGQARAARGRVSASAGNLATSSACTMHMLIGGRCLWIVSIENYEYVPTGCVAKLANMAKDTVINELRKHSLEIRYIRRLEDPNIKAALVKNNVAHEDEEVMTIPLKSVPIILRAFLGKDVDDVFMANLEEVSREHVRNKRFGRPNRQ